MTVAGSRVKHLPGVRVVSMKRKLMWAWGLKDMQTIQTWIQKW